jgi:enamine deaminase RidA (YjgF/YER057c/UK114 family)
MTETLLTPASTLETLDKTLPAAPKPVANYVTCVRVGNLLFTSGVLPMKDGQLLAKGTVGQGEGCVTVEEAKACAKQALMNALSVVRDELGTLTAVTRVVKLCGFVQCEAGFDQQPAIMNGASDALVESFGQAIGSHARTAVGTNALPLQAPVELELIVAFDPALAKPAI